MQKRWEFTNYDMEEATKLYQQLNIDPVFCQLLVQRGIRNYAEAKMFFRPQLTHLHDPFLMKDMERSVQRITEAIIKKEKILIYGDYDVDGTTSVALVYTFLSDYHAQLDFYIPDRHKEGYGISIKGVEYANKNQCSLVIALDCGIKALKAIKYANEKGIDFIVCDHHLPDAELPQAYAILNPKQTDCEYPYKELSGCAIGFKLVEGFAQAHNISFKKKVVPLLDLVAVSLACDFVPLTGENRVLASFGLERLNCHPRTGLKVLMKLLNGAGEYSIRDIVFGIGPHINAAGRVDHASAAVRLLISSDKTEAGDLASNLMSKNHERRDIEYDILLQAKEMVSNDIAFGEKKALVLYDKNWHKGVIGIVASKMVDEYHKPSIIFTESNGRIVGSARSVSGFDIYKAIEHCKDLLVNYGGHKYAAGLTIKDSNLAEFTERFQRFVSKSITKMQMLPVQYIDAEIKMELINKNFWNILDQFSPFGPKNMRPVFSSKKLKDTGYSKLIRERHLKLKIKQGKNKPVEGIAFGLGHHINMLITKKHFDVCYVLEKNTFRGRSRLQMNVKDLRFEPG